ncbi:hypothetical protein CR152_15790 [Massilia violaceinigra]|uniref:Uncharacterized protein n=1 Tax=Massilia violaceinigra TaxID=2045208 RepID=A0A2D2DLG4_9BURK|nr:hypothetical protein CR152_15790 [Massilia violaceinigra]
MGRKIRRQFLRQVVFNCICAMKKTSHIDISAKISPIRIMKLELIGQIYLLRSDLQNKYALYIINGFIYFLSSQSTTILKNRGRSINIRM